MTESADRNAKHLLDVKRELVVVYSAYVTLNDVAQRSTDPNTGLEGRFIEGPDWQAWYAATVARIDKRGR